MAKRADYYDHIEDLGITIYKCNYYHPELIKREAKEALLIPMIISTTILSIALTTGFEGLVIIAASSILPAALIWWNKPTHELKAAYDACRLAFDLINEKILSQSDDEENNSLYEAEMDLIGMNNETEDT